MDLTERISANFSLKELVKSSTALRLGIDNSPDEAQLAALRLLAANVLQPVRDQFGSTSISSGLRVLELNRAVKSKDTSQHVKGEAADFECLSSSNLATAGWIQENCAFDQLILEFYTPGDPLSGWVHCSALAAENRYQVLTAYRNDQGVVVYETGLKLRGMDDA